MLLACRHVEQQLAAAVTGLNALDLTTEELLRDSIAAARLGLADELARLRELDLAVPLQFENYR